MYTQHWYQNWANYKGTIVCLKHIPLTSRKHGELSRDNMIEMRSAEGETCIALGHKKKEFNYLKSLELK